MNVLVGLVLIIVGFVNVLSPKSGWYLSHGWRYKDAEPSEAALFFARLGGVVGIIVGLIFMFTYIL